MKPLEEIHFSKIKQLLVENMDLYTYMNLKFIYVGRHIFRETRELYHDLLTVNANLNNTFSKIL